MIQYLCHYVHRVSSKSPPGDGSIRGLPSDLGSRDMRGMAAALRDAGLLGKGERLRDMLVEDGGRIVCFPKASVWHSIILTPVDLVV